MYTPITLAEGVTFLAIPDDRFKTDRLTVALTLPTDRSRMTARSVLPFLLTRCCEEYPSLSAMRLRLDTLYGADILADVVRMGDNQMLLMSAVCLADRYALNGDRVSAACVELMLKQLFHPALEEGVFRAEDVEQERRCLIEFIASEINSKRAYARRRCEGLLCADRPCGLNEYGSAEDAEAMTAADITAGWKEILGTAQIHVIYQGSGDADGVIAKVREAFAAYGPRHPVAFCAPVALPERDCVRESEEMPLNQAKLFLGFRTPVVGSGEAVDATRMAAALLGGTSQSLLFKNVREKRSLCYYCAATYDRYIGEILVDSGVDEEKAAATEQEILHQLERLKNNDFSDEEWQATRLVMLGRMRGCEDSQGSKESWYLNRLVSGDLCTPAEGAGRLAAVTREQAVAAAAEWQLGCVYLLKSNGEEGDDDE